MQLHGGGRASLLQGHSRRRLSAGLGLESGKTPRFFGLPGVARRLRRLRRLGHRGARKGRHSREESILWAQVQVQRLSENAGPGIEPRDRLLRALGPEAAGGGRLMRRISPLGGRRMNRTGLASHGILVARFMEPVESVGKRIAILGRLDVSFRQACVR